MTLSLDDSNAAYQIQGYSAGQVQINDKIYTQSLIISPERLLDDWPPQTIDQLTAAHLQIIYTLKPAILLLGTGSVLHFPPLTVYGHLLNAGIGVEVMNTHAACQTFKVLSAEGRKVVAALILR